MLTTEEAWDTVKKWDGLHRSPSPENRRRPDGIRMLQNSFVETVFTTAHPLSILLWWGPFVGWAVYRTTQTHTLPAGAGLFSFYSVCLCGPCVVCSWRRGPCLHPCVGGALPGLFGALMPISAVAR